jgi:hypothetical protein
MKTTSAAAILTAAVVTMSAPMVGAASEPVPLFVAPQLNRGWSTVFTNEIPLQWNWNTNAARAQLDIVGMNGSVSTNFFELTTNWLWRAFASAAPAAEDVYALTLTFYSGAETVVGAQTSRLAVIQGAFGEASLDPGPSDRTWTRVRENSVIPYDAGWAEATASAKAGQLVIEKAGGLMQTNALSAASGFFGWKVKRSDWGYGTFDLALSFPETVTNVWDATLVRVPEGFMFSVK